MRMCLVICPGEKCLRRMSLLLLCLPLKGRTQLVSFCMSCVEGAGVNLCHLFLEGNPRYLGRQRHHPFPKRYNSVSSNRSSFPQKLKVASRKQESFDDQSKYLSCISRTTSARLGPFITMCGAASVPLGPSITMRGTASVPLRYRSGHLLQCAVPPRYHFGTEHDVPVYESFLTWAQEHQIPDECICRPTHSFGEIALYWVKDCMSAHTCRGGTVAHPVERPCIDVAPKMRREKYWPIDGGGTHVLHLRSTVVLLNFPTCTQPDFGGLR